jgi:hypothetical protein
MAFKTEVVFFAVLYPVVFEFFEHVVQSEDIDAVVGCFFVFKCDDPCQPTAEPILVIWEKYDATTPDIGGSLPKIDVAQQALKDDIAQPFDN